MANLTDDGYVKYNRKKAIMALVSCLVVFVCVCVGVVMNLTTLEDQNFDNMGIKTFKMFTVNSNILVGLCCIIAFPMIFDGIRKNNYHLPNWVVDFFYAGVLAVTLTFVISLCLLSPVKGFVLIFTGSRFFLHGLCPILSIVAFTVFISDHRVRIFESLLALIPVFIYALIYVVMVFIIGEQNGGWEDIYSFNKFLPWYVMACLILPATFGLSVALGKLHNISNAKMKADEAEFFKNLSQSDELEDIVVNMAKVHKKFNKLSDIVIPRRIISIIANEKNCSEKIPELCALYLKVYVQDDK